MSRIAWAGLCWLACAVGARADVIVFHPPETRVSDYTVPVDAKSLTDQIPGAPNFVLQTKNGRTNFAMGRLEGLDEPYTWATGVMPGAPRTLIFRPRLPNGALANQTVIVDRKMVQRIHHEVDHPLDLALLFGDRGLPDSVYWKASMLQALGPLAKMLPNQQPLNTKGLSLPPEASLALRGAVLYHLLDRPGTGSETEAELEARAKAVSQEMQRDMSAQLAYTAGDAVRMLLQGLAELDHFPHLSATDQLPPLPGGEPGYEGFRRAIKVCLSFLCRLVGVDPSTEGGQRLFYAGQESRSAVIAAIEAGGSGHLDVELDEERFVDFRAQMAQVQPSGTLSEQDVEDYRSLFDHVPAQRPLAPPRGLPLSPTQATISTLEYLIHEPSWWLIYPEADDSFTLVRGLITLAPLTDQGGQLLPDVRNVDNEPAGVDFTGLGGARTRLCGPNGLGVRALSLLLHDPRVAARDDPAFEAWARSRAAKIRGADPALELERRIAEATEVFGSHVLQLATGAQYGQQRWINRALLFANKSGSLRAESEAVRNLFSVATLTEAPRPGPDPSPFGGDAGLGAFDWGAGGDAQPTREARQQAIETLLTLANMGTDDKPATVAEFVIQGLHEIDLRRALEVATPGELTLLKVVGLLEQQAKDGSTGDAQRMARGTGRRLSARLSAARDENGTELSQAERDLAEARKSGTPEAEAEAQRRVDELRRRGEGLRRMRR